MGKKIVEKLKKREVIDPNTGEIIQTEEIQTIVVGDPYQDDDFVKIYPAFFSTVAEWFSIKNGRLKLYLLFIEKLMEKKINDEPVVIITVKEMMERLGLSKPRVLSYLRELIKKGLIAKYKNEKGQVIRSCYVVNPQYVFKGQLAKYYKHLPEHIIELFKRNSVEEKRKVVEKKE